MLSPGSNIALRLISGGWWGLTLGLLLGGGWNTLLAVFSLVYAVCMAGVAVLGWESRVQPSQGSRRRRAFTLAWLTAGSSAVVLIAAMNGAPPVWVVAGAAFPLAAAVVGVVELGRPARLR
ncbi:MAG: hypothetical protein QOJ57_1040 [Thermoleophilaceae bacterium]|jgi:hypothetical protein|nr:hypothetical protein [Thermoleophilaceae bacterium]